MTRRKAFLCALFSCAAFGCKVGGDTVQSKAVETSLSSEIDFPRGMLISDPLPATTAPDAVLMPLGPTPVVAPGEGGIMALEVDDPMDRSAGATLIQFEGEGSHVRVPDPKTAGTGVIENDFVSAKNLCKGRCNAIFSVQVQEKLELSDGKISAGTTREIVVDCRKSGNASSCPAKNKDAGAGGGLKNLCGDVTAGQIALSGDRVLDAYLDAVRQLSKVGGGSIASVQSALTSIAASLGLPASSTAEEIKAALEMQIAANTQGGLSALLADQGCGVRREQVSLALRTCDPSVTMVDATQCSGRCEPGSNTSVCSSAGARGCRGLLSPGACLGTCTGACETILGAPAACAGTCVGTCDGPCPDDGKGGCAGPCSGMCTGSCRTLSTSTCSGNCSGLCDVSQGGAPSCSDPLRPYCDSAMGGDLSCPGDCFGQVALTAGADACRASALALAQSFPRCEAPLVQLTFAFAPGLAASDQLAFATLVHDLNGPLVKLYREITRLGLFQDEAAALQTAGQGAIMDELNSRLQASPEDSGLGCANKTLPDVATWLADEPAKLSAAQADAKSLIALLGTL